MSDEMVEFVERAAWLEFCNGLDRFSAETVAAREMGKKRWEFTDENCEGNFTTA